MTTHIYNVQVNNIYPNLILDKTLKNKDRNKVEKIIFQIKTLEVLKKYPPMVFAEAIFNETIKYNNDVEIEIETNSIVNKKEMLVKETNNTYSMILASKYFFIDDSFFNKRVIRDYVRKTKKFIKLFFKKRK